MMSFAVVVGLVIAVLAVCHGLGWFSCSRYRRDAFMLLAVAAFVFAPTLAGHLRAQNAPAAGFPDLVGGLKAAPGCLGVDTARALSGQHGLFPWFRDQEAGV